MSFLSEDSSILPELKVNILLVDDEPKNLLALSAILENLGQNLIIAHSGEEALRCLLQQDFALILLDVQMPGMDGFETAKLIRSRARSRYTPIIFLTAYSNCDQSALKGYALGAVEYLVKPIVPEVLKSKVAVFLELFQKTALLEAANAELRHREARFRALSASSPVGIFLTDAAGCWTYTNPRCQAICGSLLPKTKIQDWSGLIHPEDRNQVITNWSTWIQAGREYSSEFRLLPNGKSVRWVYLRAAPIRSESGALIGYAGTIEDITESKIAEAERSRLMREQLARQEAEAANRMKDEFIATLSHELRTPLNAMLGWVALLRTRKFDEATIARALETIERNTKTLANQIEDLLDISRIITGKLRLQVRELNIKQLLVSAIDVMLPVAAAKGVEIFSNFDSDVGLISGDPDRLLQVVLNLLSNAVKFTPAGGQVEVSLRRSNSYIQLQVQDTGQGISAEFLPYVFDRFRQADSTNTRPHGGLGLGLAIVRHLVEQHGGKVYADSPGEGQGATFTVELPLLGAVDATTKAEELPLLLKAEISPSCPLTLDGLRVLVVDDEADAREVISTCLKQYGADVLTAAAVNEALETLASFNPDVLISDIGMPGENGYDLIRQVRQNWSSHLKLLPAIAVTAYARESDRIEALQAGFQMYLSKPVAPTELVAAVRQLFERTKSGLEPLQEIES